jgi:hypothetical protein
VGVMYLVANSVLILILIVVLTVSVKKINHSVDRLYAMLDTRLSDHYDADATRDFRNSVEKDLQEVTSYLYEISDGTRTVITEQHTAEQFMGDAMAILKSISASLESIAHDIARSCDTTSD